MRKIVAIGGGEIGRPGYPIETMEIDKETIRLSGKENPNLLFLPTACGDKDSYCDCVQKLFGDKLGCNVTNLKLIDNPPSYEKIKEMILSSDIIYVGGGNTLKMIAIWKNLGVDKLLKQAMDNGTVLSGLSAGSICWFKYGNSDSEMFDKNFNKTNEVELIRVDGLNFINALHCPHYDIEKDRKESLKEMMKEQSVVGIAIDNCCALEVVNDTYRIISSKDNANAYLVYWKDDKYIEKLIVKSKRFKPLKEILNHE